MQLKVITKNTTSPLLKNNNNNTMITGLNVILRLLARFRVATMWIPLIFTCLCFSEGVAVQQ